MNSISFSICSFIYIIIFLVVYFGKERINLSENKIYSGLLITTTIGLIIDIIGYISFKDGNITSIRNITIAKIYLIYYFTWAYLLTIYTYIISFKKKKHKDNTKVLVLLYLVMSLLIVLLPIYIKNTNSSLYSYGPSVNLVYLLSGICIIYMSACLIMKRKEINPKKYIPLFALIIFGGFVVIIQKIYPDLLLLTATESIITALMYFTIENPDMQMVEELNKNKKLTEETYTEKSNFLFKISQDLKLPLSEIENESNTIFETTTGKTKEIAEKINNNAKQLSTYVNKALDISTMDIKNLKVVTTSYNSKNLFEEICLRTKNELERQNKKIDFRYNISELPENLIGDSVKIKQTLLSIIFDSIKHTNTGFIELNINSITKYGVCRLMIDISDSGCGMNIEKVNKILSATGDLTEEELEKITHLNISISLANKMLKAINGNLIIKSEPEIGTTFGIILDQQIESKELSPSEKKLREYSKKITSNRKVLIVSTDKEIINKTKETLEKVGIETNISLYTNDCLDRIKQKEKYECILIDDTLTDESGVELLKKLKSSKKFKTPVIVMLNKTKEFMSKHYLSDGFDEYIIKEEIVDELPKLNKYL